MAGGSGKHISSWRTGSPWETKASEGAVSNIEWRGTIIQYCSRPSRLLHMSLHNNKKQMLSRTMVTTHITHDVIMWGREVFSTGDFSLSGVVNHRGLLSETSFFNRGNLSHHAPAVFPLLIEYQRFSRRENYLYMNAEEMNKYLNNTHKIAYLIQAVDSHILVD